MLGDFNEKPHPKAIYTSRPLNTLTGSPSIIMFNMKPNNKLIEESISNKEYITKEYDIKIRFRSNPINPRKQDATEDLTE
ncbi:unnamed protein product [Rhizophagus irregularis]|nr:unnamed protein product [Rhizophagus irregularis]CAB5353280.1 unnamed protein product [Rhizophagus irregularis]